MREYNLFRRHYVNISVGRDIIIVDKDCLNSNSLFYGLIFMKLNYKRNPGWFVQNNKTQILS